MKIIIPLACLLVLVGCSQMSAQAVDDAPTAWIEVDPVPYAYNDQSSGFNQTEMSIDLEPGEEMELKLAMKEGDTAVYEWRLDQDIGDLLITEFHGHTEPVVGEPGTLVFYKKHQLRQEQGSLTAAFPGDHGWYFNNLSDQVISIDFKVAGWYDSVREINF